MKILKIFLILCSIFLFLNGDDDYKKYKHSYKNLDYLNLDEKQVKAIKNILLELKEYFLDENNLETIYSQNSAFTDISILKYKSSNIYILKIKYLDESYIFKALDEESFNDKTILNVLVFLDIFALLIMFLFIIKLLSPLKTITKELKAFANGNLSTRIDIKSNDEIGTLAKSFLKNLPYY